MRSSIWNSGWIGLAMLLFMTACSKSAPVEKVEHPPLGHMEHGNMEMSAFEDASWSVRDESITGSLVFTILKDGQEWTKFDVRHEKKLHLIIVRSDLTHFQHIHPSMKPDGTWFVPFAPPEEGTYWVFADFHATNEGDHVVRFEKTYGTPTKEHYTREDLSYDPDIGGFGAGVSRMVDGIRIGATVHEFAMPTGTRAGIDVMVIPFDAEGNVLPVEPYLGAQGHSVWISPAGDYVHAHPDEEYIYFKKTDPPHFVLLDPKEEPYRVFIEIKVQGKVHTAVFDWPFPPLPLH